MTATSQESKPEPNAGASPAQGQGEGAARTVPLGEHIDLRKRLRELEDENAKLKGSAATITAPVPTPPPTAPTADIKDLQRRAAVEDLTEELGVSRKQASAVHDVLQANPQLSAVEAKSLAAMRNAELFKGSDDGFQAGTHGAARPGVALPPNPKPDIDPIEDRLTKIKAMPSKSRQDLYLNNLLGSIAAEDVGKPGHQLLPL